MIIGQETHGEEPQIVEEMVDEAEVSLNAIMGG